MPLPGSTRPDYEAVFDAAPGPYLLLDPAFTIVGVTDAYLAATMTVREGILGRNLFEVFPDNPDDPAATGTRNLRASLLRVLATRRPDRMPVQKYDIRRPEAKGGGFEERYWSPLNSPVLGNDGELRQIIHWVEDVTEFIRLKLELEAGRQIQNDELPERTSRIDAPVFLTAEAVEANRRLSESGRRYRFLADAIPLLVWTAGPDGLIDYCNERWFRFTGRPFDQLQGNAWHQVLHPEERDRVVSAWSDAVRTGAKQFQVEHRMRFHDGTWRWTLTTALPYRDAVGVVRKWFGATTDIHDRVMADEQIRQAQRLQAVGKLAGGMAHEVNNMMSTVLGFGELVAQALGPDHPQAQDVREMISAGVRAADVTRQLLAFSRQQVLKPVVLDLNAVVAELTAVLQHLVGSDRRLEVVPAASEVRVLADRSQIEQVLINLVANARDATTTDGMIILEIQAVHLDRSTGGYQPEDEGAPDAGWYVRLAVRDNGAGMPPEVQARAFDPFFTTKAVGHGTGLGLSTVLGIVQQSGGDVRIDSTPGEGTVVVVLLPMVDLEVSKVPETQAAPRGAGEVVLVVEDESMVRSLARRALETHGYTVHQAPNGAAALDFLTMHPGMVDLVLTDIVMPRMSGRELAERLAQRQPDVPVLLMSGYSGDEMVQRGLILAGVPFLQKPITPGMLAAAVRERLQQGRRTQGAQARLP